MIAGISFHLLKLISDIRMASALQLNAADGMYSNNKHAYTEDWARTVSAHDKSNPGDEPDITPSNPSVSDLFDLCMKIFQSACYCNGRLDSSPDPGLSVILMKDELVRLHLWADDLPIDVVDRSFDSTMDFLRKQILHHLIRIGQLLLRCKFNINFRWIEGSV